MSDIEMPEMNGLELCKQLQDSDIKIVFISSHQNYEYFRYACLLYTSHFKDPTLRVAKAFAWVSNTENEKGRNG